MFKRNALKSLQKWKGKENRKPLVIRGARQVGKTTLVQTFSKGFETFFHLNLEKQADRELFEQNFSAREILSAIHLYSNMLKEPGSTLLFIDEIQNSPQAISSLRYFYEEVPEVHVIAAGSLLETMINVPVSFPVGRVEYMALRPCSFAEFLEALGEVAIKDALQSATLPQAIHSRVTKLFNEYVLVGGMPEAIASYAGNKDVVALSSIYETLLTGYSDDTEKYAKTDTLHNVLRHILTYGWQYAGQRIKFERFANSNYKSREMGEAFRVLEKAFLLELSYPTTSTAIPILPDLKKSPKLLWLDTGLVNYSIGLQKELFGINDISELWKGKIAEHIVAQELLSISDLVSAKRNFWVREARNSQAEVDFLYSYEGEIIPIEVKSGDNSKLKSLHLFMEESPVNKAVRFWNNPLSLDTITLPSGKQYALLNLPLYYAGQLPAILDKYSS